MSKYLTSVGAKCSKCNRKAIIKYVDEDKVILLCHKHWNQLLKFYIKEEMKK